MGIPALALDRMHERVRWDWFRRYMPDPASLRPGTRMPSFWPEGRAANTEILDGNTDQQIKAIWAWLAGGAKADVPAGLIRSRQEVVVDKEAVIYRNFIEGAGARAIGVGYPEHANLAFDANNTSLAMIWQGGFIDMSRHSTDRGVGFEPPLGDQVVKLPGGAPFAVLGASDAAWPKDSGKAAGYRFLGYSLDDVRRPTFRYAFGGIRVEDTPVPKAVDVDVDDVPYPARHLIDNSVYFSFISQLRNFTCFITSRGCPYKCIFCEQGSKPFRARSPKNVVDELELCAKEHGIRELDFFDSSFTIRKDRVIEICAEINAIVASARAELVHVLQLPGVARLDLRCRELLDCVVQLGSAFSLGLAGVDSSCRLAGRSDLLPRHRPEVPKYLMCPRPGAAVSERRIFAWKLGRIAWRLGNGGNPRLQPSFDCAFHAAGIGWDFSLREKPRLPPQWNFLWGDSPAGAFHR
jgi:hypothetical protein